MIFEQIATGGRQSYLLGCADSRGMKMWRERDLPLSIGDVA